VFPKKGVHRLGGKRPEKDYRMGKEKIPGKWGWGRGKQNPRSGIGRMLGGGGKRGKARG